jgi:hypothetical protein
VREGGRASNLVPRSPSAFAGAYARGPGWRPPIGEHGERRRLCACAYGVAQEPGWRPSNTGYWLSAFRAHERKNPYFSSFLRRTVGVCAYANIMPILEKLTNYLDLNTTF